MSIDSTVVEVELPTLTDIDAPAPGRSRRNRGSEVVRAALINAAIGEFAARGFEGASTRRIAEAAGAHQSQIKYHFDTKDDLWRRCVELLLDDVAATIAAQLPERGEADDRAAAEATIRGLVAFMARRPELNRIMLHEATAPSARLDWLVDTHLAARQAGLARAWARLVESGAAAPIEPDLIYHTLIGAASLLYSNAPEARAFGIEPADPELVARHADALVALFLRPDPSPEGTDR
jgi:AcrR family transcriptional regulator